MKKFNFILFAIAAMFTLVFTSCEKEDNPAPRPEPEDTVE